MFPSCTRYLTEKKELLTQVTDEHTLLSNALNKGKWRKIIRDYQKNPDQLAIHGLNAFHANLISQEQFSTLLARWSLMKEIPKVSVKFARLSKKDLRDKNSSKKVQQLFQTFDRSKDFSLNTTQKKAFLEALKVVPKSERGFFYIKSYDLEKERLDKTMTISEKIASLGIKIFYKFHDKEQYRMVPSFSLMQIFLNCQAGENAVRLKPTLGLSTLQDIAQNGKTDSRDVALTFVNMNLPKVADSRPVPYTIDFIFHDFYHSLIASQIPSLYRKALIAFAEKTSQLKEKTADPFEIGFLDLLYEKIVDMEFPEFIKNPSSFSELKKTFLYITGNSVFKAFERYLSDQLEISKESSYVVHFRCLLKLFQSQTVPKIALILFETGFCEEFEITTQDLAYNASLRMGVKSEEFNRLKHVLNFHTVKDAFSKKELKFLQKNIHLQMLDLSFLLLILLEKPTVTKTFLGCLKGKPSPLSIF